MSYYKVDPGNDGGLACRTALTKFLFGISILIILEPSIHDRRSRYHNLAFRDAVNVNSLFELG